MKKKLVLIVCCIVLIASIWIGYEVLIRTSETVITKIYFQSYRSRFEQCWPKYSYPEWDGQSDGRIYRFWHENTRLNPHPMPRYFSYYPSFLKEVYSNREKTRQQRMDAFAWLIKDLIHQKKAENLEVISLYYASSGKLVLEARYLGEGNK